MKSSSFSVLIAPLNSVRMHDCSILQLGSDSFSYSECAAKDKPRLSSVSRNTKSSAILRARKLAWRSWLVFSASFVFWMLLVRTQGSSTSQHKVFYCLGSHQPRLWGITTLFRSGLRKESVQNLAFIFFLIYIMMVSLD